MVAERKNCPNYFSSKLGQWCHPKQERGNPISDFLNYLGTYYHAKCSSFYYIKQMSIQPPFFSIWLAYHCKLIMKKRRPIKLRFYVKEHFVSKKNSILRWSVGSFNLWAVLEVKKLKLVYGCIMRMTTWQLKHFVMTYLRLIHFQCTRCMIINCLRNDHRSFQVK